MKKIICTEPDRKKAKIIIDNLEDEAWWSVFAYDKATGNIEESPVTGEALWARFGYKVEFHLGHVSVNIHGKDYQICSKNKLWEAGEDYEQEILNAFWAAEAQGLLPELEKLSTRIGSEMSKPENN